MKIVRRISFYFLVTAALIACKNEAENSKENAVNEVAEVSEEKSVEQDTKPNEVLANSVMAKLMVTSEAKTFTQYSISAGIVDLLSKEEGPYTLLVPSNEAFAELSQYKRDELANMANNALLTTLIKNHIVAGDYSSADLTQTLRNNKATTLHSLGGANLMVYMEGTNLMIKDSKGVAAKVGKSDILGKNGKVHIIDAVLTATK